MVRTQLPEAVGSCDEAVAVEESYLHLHLAVEETGLHLEEETLGSAEEEIHSSKFSVQKRHRFFLS